MARTSPSVACLCFQSESVMEWPCREGPKRTSPYPGQADKEVVLPRSRQHRDWHCRALIVALTQVTSLRRAPQSGRGCRQHGWLSFSSGQPAGRGEGDESLLCPRGVCLPVGEQPWFCLRPVSMGLLAKPVGLYGAGRCGWRRTGTPQRPWRL